MSGAWRRNGTAQRARPDGRVANSAAACAARTRAGDREGRT